MRNKEILHKDIKFILNSFHFQSVESYVLNGLKREVKDINIMDPSGVLSETWKSLDPSHAKFLMVLASDIYNHLYSHDERKEALIDPEIANDFVLRLSAANHGSGFWEQGWEWLGEDVETGMQRVRKEQVIFWVEKENVQLMGSTCMIKKEKEIRHLNPYFYFAYGNAGSCAERSGETVRIYWNLNPDGAIDLLDHLTDIFNTESIAFTVKVLSDATKYNRRDAGVLYINRSELPQALPLIEKIIMNLSENSLGTSVPMFVRQLYPGVGFAEDPGGGFSFGISRSKIIAEALFDAYRTTAGNKNPEQQLQHTFLINGLDANLPYAPAKRLDAYETLFKSLIVYANNAN